MIYLENFSTAGLTLSNGLEPPPRLDAAGGRGPDAEFRAQDAE